MRYDESHIRILTAVEAIRRRPAMYLGPLDDPTLLNRLIQESLCIAADEALAGHCTRVRVEVHRDGSVTVRDNGRGLPMTPDAEGRPLAERLLTQLFACREHKDGRAAEACCQMGLVVVNAVSEWLRMRNFWDGTGWSQSYERGKSLGPFRRDPSKVEPGVELCYRPDPSLLGPLRFDGRALACWFGVLGLPFASVEIGAADAADGSAVVEFEGITPEQRTDS
jgi:DNA gyrase subunit B